MDPQENSLQEHSSENIHLQERFGDGLQDTSLPAAQVLTEQEEARASEQRPPLLAPERISLGYIP